MKRRFISSFLAGVMVLTLLGCGASDSANKIDREKVQEVVKIEDVMNEKPEYTESTGKIARAISHDPSIIKEPGTGNYYVFGTHLTVAKTTDLVNWEQISKEYETVENNPVYGDLSTNLDESFQWAGRYDGDFSNGFAVWAPDVYWDDYCTYDTGDLMVHGNLE